MKNKIILGCILLLLFTIHSCITTAAIKIKPREGTIGTLQIDIGENYQFRTYDKVETESGCTVTLYFDKKAKDKND